MLPLSCKPPPLPYSLQLLLNPVCPTLSHNTLRFLLKASQVIILFPALPDLFLRCLWAVPLLEPLLDELCVRDVQSGSFFTFGGVWEVLEVLECRWLCFAAGLLSCGAFGRWWIRRSQGTCEDLS